MDQPDLLSFIREALVWDAHACLPLNAGADLRVLERHRAAGVDFVSVNIGMDMNPREQIFDVMRSFTEQLDANDDAFVRVNGIVDVKAAKAGGRLAVAFDLEGGVPLDSRPEEVQRFYDLGVRQVHLAYNRNNEIGGGCYDDDIPLTALGRDIVAAINDAGMLMDCSHTGYRTSLDIMEASRSPVIFSHANSRVLHEDGRNITDEQIDACVATGGVICVNGVGRFLGDLDAGTSAILRHIDYMVERAGADHVGLGIDYEYPENGFASLPPDTDKDYWWPREHGYSGGLNVKIAVPEQFPEIVDGLFERSYAERDIRAILGENMYRVAGEVWK